HLFQSPYAQQLLLRGICRLQQGSAQCFTDKDCPAGKFCNKAWEELPFCAACHGPRRRCQRNTMCCPGMLCINGIKEPFNEGERGERKIWSEAQHQKNEDHGHWSHHLLANRRGRNGEGESCLRTSDCAAGLCCARHFWAKICKPVLKEGQVCSRRGQKDGSQGPEIFQRCDCGPGLSCQLPLSGEPQRSRLRVCWRN
uniref:Dickkopf WNT signaling pathway inhibitor 4 n=1 Tax=Podarcis muralis TaxID=64176 RepID=A0A670IZA5_PODMU